MRRTMKREERWRDGISRKHRSSIFPADYQQLLRSGPADILLTHEAPSAHPHGWQAVDELSEALGVQLVVHGHHHQNIDYLVEGMQSAAAPFRAFGVDMGSHLTWPLCSNSPPKSSGQTLGLGWTSLTSCSTARRLPLSQPKAARKR